MTGVEKQALKYGDGVPDALDAPVRPVPFLYLSTGVETRHTNRLDPEPRSRPREPARGQPPARGLTTRNFPLYRTRRRAILNARAAMEFSARTKSGRLSPMPTPSPSSIGIGHGSYTAGQASRLSGLRRERVTRWIRGYSFPTEGGRKGVSPPIFAADRPTDAPLSLTFLDLVEILFVKAFLDHGVSMRTIRLAAQEGTKLFKVNHPFCLKRFETDGRGVFASVAKDADDEAIVNLVSGQAAFPKVIRPLFKQIDYDVAGEIAAAWWPRGKSVPIVVDPARAFGTPIVSERGVPTHVLAGPVAAGDSPEMVARWFEVPLADVKAAVEFERSLLAA